MSTAEPQQSPSRVRLHLAPFTPALFTSLLPKAQQALATSVSYHSTQSDPDRGFGYLELPTEEAEKLRRKLNGAILRGAKMSVEKAKPEKRKRSDDVGLVAQEERPKKRKDRKKSKGKDVLPGVEVPADRKIKRGWTEVASKADKDGKRAGSTREKSRYTDKAEMLFKAGKVKASSESSAKKADKKTKDGKSKAKQVKQQVVHEFENTTHFPTFLKKETAERKGGPLEFVDGTGWVDEDGNVVEEVKTNRRRPPPAAEAPPPDVVMADATPKQASTKAPESTSKKTSVAEPEESQSSPSSEEDSDSESSSSDSSSDSEEEESTSTPKPPAAAATPPRSTSATPASTTTAPTPLPSTEKPEVHPLEALYKRRPDDTPRPAPIQTSFSFFDPDSAAPEDAETDAIPTERPDTSRQRSSSAAVPQTPFTTADLRFRGLRSAAPTPDTAVAGKRFFASFGADEDDEEEDEDEGAGKEEEPVETRTKEKRTRSAMVDEFYAKRAELNRGWHLRKKEADRKSSRLRDAGRGGRMR